MHAFWFRLKRASHASIRIGRIALSSWAPLTPARFDLLFILYESPVRAIDQKHLTRLLGLHHSTVSKMLSRLEELGLVCRWPIEEDFRQRGVGLTEEGWRLMAAAIGEVRGNGYVDLAISCGVLPLRFYDAPRVEAKLRRLDGTLRRYALALYDTAMPLYANQAPPNWWIPRPTKPPRPRGERRCARPSEKAT